MADIDFLEEIKNTIVNILSSDQLEFNNVRASLESDKLIFQVKFSKYPSNWTISDFKYLLSQMQGFKTSNVMWTS